ncbi:MAG: HyaD/HybD family hydrogenase maturation endopeptidase [Gammaproteobacteria bacterium]|nr:HyaD/HybD family hydrogenase maturation endopeptidase [Gammaproteobacteria bacterium]
MLGLGNTLLGDEGAGVHAVRQMQQLHSGHPDIEFMDGGTLSFTLAGPIEQADNLIVVDAAELHAPAGTLRVFVGEEMDRFLGGSRKASVHEVSLLDLMSVALLAGRLPRQRALVGIQPQFLDWADRPSEAVARAIPRVCSEVISLAGAWQ